MKNRKKNTKLTPRQSLKRLLWLTALSGMICAITAVSTFVFFFIPRDRDTYILTVPEFVGLNEADIGEYQNIEIEREWIYSSEIKKGMVISQEPYAGARRKKKSGDAHKVTLFISLGEKTQGIPDLAGVEEMSAAAALRTIGARVRIMPIFGEGKDGCVLYTSPAATTEIKEGETVTIFVSRQRTDEPVTVPNLCGLRLSEAYSRALAIGLLISYENDDSLDQTVTVQSIVAGASVKKGSYISFKTENDSRQWPPTVSENN